MYTKLPNYLIDDHLHDLTHGELVVFLYVLRRTIGFGKAMDRITLRQFVEGIQTKDGRRLDHGTGLSRRQVLYSIKSLEQRGLLVVERQTGAASVYGVQWAAPLLVQPTAPGGCNPLHPIKRKLSKRRENSVDTKDVEARVINC